MKRILILALIVSLASLLKAQDFTYDKPVKNIKATIKVLEGQEITVIVPDGSTSQRYISIQLPEEYKKDGLKVTYSGLIGKIPPNVRMMGIPLKLTSISVSSKDYKAYKLKKCKYKFG